MGLARLCPGDWAIAGRAEWIVDDEAVGVGAV